MSLFLTIYFNHTHLAAAKSHFKEHFDEAEFALLELQPSKEGTIRLSIEHSKISDFHDPIISTIPFPFTGSLIHPLGDEQDLQICGDGTDQNSHETIMEQNHRIQIPATYDEGEIILDEAALEEANEFAVFHEQCHHLTLSPIECTPLNPQSGTTTNQELINHLGKFPPDRQIAHLIICEDDIIASIHSQHGEEIKVTREEVHDILHRVRKYATLESGLTGELIESCYPSSLRQRIADPSQI